MWRGAFEGEESGEGRRVYRLRWQPRTQDGDEVALLTEGEMRNGLFIRYLIDHGKLSEILDAPIITD